MYTGFQTKVKKIFFEKKYENAPSQIFISYNIYNTLEKLPPGKQASYLEKFIPNHPMVASLRQNFAVTFGRLHVDVNLVDGVELDVEAFKKSKPEYADIEFVREDEGKYICGTEVEKMSKSKFNTINPDDLVVKYGADTFRMYEMFLGPAYGISNPLGHLRKP